jgi:hypothetical protein
MMSLVQHNVVSPGAARPRPAALMKTASVLRHPCSDARTPPGSLRAGRACMPMSVSRAAPLVRTRAWSHLLAVLPPAALCCRAHAGELSNVLREAGHPAPPELLRFGTHVKKKESKLYGNHFKDIDTSIKAKKTTFADEDDD